METLVGEELIHICKICKTEMKETAHEGLRCPSCDMDQYDCGIIAAVKQTITRILLRG